MTIEINGARKVKLSNNRFQNIDKPFILRNCGDIEADNNHAFSSIGHRLPGSHIYGSLKEYYLQGLIYAKD